MISKFITTWKQHARQLKAETYALYLAYRDPRTPWYAKLLAICIVAYAFSPIDLIPDFVPILGYLDDLIILPAAITLTLKLIPPDILATHRRQAQVMLAQGKPTNWTAGVIIILIWLLFASLVSISLCKFSR